MPTRWAGLWSVPTGKAFCPCYNIVHCFHNVCCRLASRPQVRTGWVAMQLRTERLILRPHRADDWSAVAAYANHPDVLRYRPDDVRLAEQMRAHLQHLVAAQLREPRTS